MAAIFHVAQANIALPHDVRDESALDSFFGLSNLVNEAADSSPGFIWRPRTPLEIPRLLGTDGLLMTISVWRTEEHLRAFVFRGIHSGALKRRREWFQSLPEAHAVLWWIPAGSLPSAADAEDRLIHLRRHGPTPYAFHFGQTYPSPVR